MQYKLRREQEEENGASEKDIEEMLYNAVLEIDIAEDVRTFEDAGIMTKNYGVVATINGKRYQFQINGSWRD